MVLRIVIPISKLNEIYQAKGAKSFLDSKGRNSFESRKAYGIGLLHLQSFLDTDGGTLSSIVQSITSAQVNVYEMLNDFVSYLINKKLTPLSIRLYISTAKSYLEYNDIDIVPYKFRKKVTLPKISKEDEEAIDNSDIRKIVLSISHRRLKAYVLVLASGSMRAVEALAIRLKDIDFSVSPTKIHIRKEYAKTRVARDIYISDEATQYLKQWIDFKYRNKQPELERLVFAAYEKVVEVPSTLYRKISGEFAKVLDIVGFGERKEGEDRRKVTLHSLRRNAKGVISDQAGKDYSEWFLGHAKSSYWTKKESYKRNIYATKIMKHLTFLDYTTLEATGKSIEGQLTGLSTENAALKREIQELKQAPQTGIETLKEQIEELQKKQEQTHKNMMDIANIRVEDFLAHEEIILGRPIRSQEDQDEYFELIKSGSEVIRKRLMERPKQKA